MNLLFVILSGWAAAGLSGLKGAWTGAKWGSIITAIKSTAGADITNAKIAIVDALSDAYPIFLSVGISVAAFLCAWHMIKLSKEFIDGGQFDIWKFIRPMIILFVVSNFGMIYSAFDGILTSVNNKIIESIGFRDPKTVIEQMSVNIEEALKQHREEVQRHNAEATKLLKKELASRKAERNNELDQLLNEGNLNMAEKISACLTNMYHNTFELKQEIIAEDPDMYAQQEVNSMGIMDWSFEQIEFFMLYAAKLLQLIMELMSHVILTMLMIFGPLAFALSVLPMWQNNINSWFSRYIQISLWTPLCHIFAKTLMAMIEFSNMSGGGGVIGNNSFWNSAIDCVIIGCVLLLMISVPKWAGLIIESSGANGVHDNLARVGMSMARI